MYRNSWLVQPKYFRKSNAFLHTFNVLYNIYVQKQLELI